MSKVLEYSHAYLTSRACENREIGKSNFYETKKQSAYESVDVVETNGV
jgi:hypothetical protein